MKKGNIDKTASALGCSQRRVHGLVAEGVLPKPRNGMHNIAKCRTLYEEYRLANDKEARIERDQRAAMADMEAGRPIRWTIELAAREFGISEKRITDGLRRTGALSEASCCCDPGLISSEKLAGTLQPPSI